MDKEVLNLLIYSLDNELSTEENIRLEKALASSEELRAEKERLLKMRVLMADLQQEPNPRFVSSVMEKIREAAEPVFTKVIIQMFPKVAAACVILVLAFFISIYVTEGTLSKDAIIGVQELSVDEALTLTEYK